MLFSGVHDVLTGAFTPLYQDAVYVQHVTLDDDNAANDFKDPVRAPQDHPCKVQIDTSSRGQRSDGGVRIRGSRAKILTESLAVIPKAQDKIKYTPIGDSEVTYTVIDYVGTDPVNTYYIVTVER